MLVTFSLDNLKIFYWQITLIKWGLKKLTASGSWRHWRRNSVWSWRTKFWWFMWPPQRKTWKITLIKLIKTKYSPLRFNSFGGCFPLSDCWNRKVGNNASVGPVTSLWTMWPASDVTELRAKFVRVKSGDSKECISKLYRLYRGSTEIKDKIPWLLTITCCSSNRTVICPVWLWQITLWDR